MLGVAFGGALADNLVLVRLVGICPAIGGPSHLRLAAALGLSQVVAIAVASVASVAIDRYLLVPFDLGHLRILALVSVVLVSAAFAARVAGSWGVGLGGKAGRSQVALVANCAVLAVALLAIGHEYGLTATLVYGLSAGLGLFLVTVLMCGLRERMELGPVPESLKGLPIGLVTGGLAALAFMGFLGMSNQ